MKQTAQLRDVELIPLLHMKLRGSQRVVHQLPCEPDDSGHISFPESVFFRTCWRGETPRMTKPAFRALLRMGWIVRTAAGVYGAQDEYGLSEAAHRRFSDDPEWQAGLFRWKAALREAA